MLGWAGTGSPETLKKGLLKSREDRSVGRSTGRASIQAVVLILHPTESLIGAQARSVWLSHRHSCRGWFWTFLLPCAVKRGLPARVPAPLPAGIGQYHSQPPSQGRISRFSIDKQLFLRKPVCTLGNRVTFTVWLLLLYF